MKNIIKSIKVLGIAALAAVSFSSCTFEEQIDPNGPSLEGVQSNASIGQLNELVVGIESTLRNGIAIETTASGTMARELYLFDADPRNTGDLLGKNGIPLDNNSFYSTAQWGGSYRCIKNANILIEAAQNTDAISAEQANGYLGFAKTVIAYELIQMAKSYGRARIDVSDPENLGPVVPEGQVLSFVRSLLNEANGNLSNAGGEFTFVLSSGFAGFDSPSSFAQFNRGVAGMAAVYAEDGPGALSALSGSHLDLAGDLNNGPKHIFSLAGGDQVNGLFKVPSTTVEDQNNGDQIIVHNSFIEEAEEGDARVANKTAPRPDPTASQDDLVGTHETRLYASQTSPIDILRNEELILLFAEANILAGNLGTAEDALNVVRNAAALPDYSGDTSSDGLTTEMLRQRRYSLWCENHRMYDLRRYGLSGTLPIDREGDQIYNTLPVPLTENL